MTGNINGSSPQFSSEKINQEQSQVSGRIENRDTKLGSMENMHANIPSAERGRTTGAKVEFKQKTFLAKATHVMRAIVNVARACWMVFKGRVSNLLLSCRKSSKIDYTASFYKPYQEDEIHLRRYVPPVEDNVMSEEPEVATTGEETTVEETAGTVTPEGLLKKAKERGAARRKIKEEQGLSNEVGTQVVGAQVNDSDQGESGAVGTAVDIEEQGASNGVDTPVNDSDQGESGAVGTQVVGAQVNDSDQGESGAVGTAVDIEEQGASNGVDTPVNDSDQRESGAVGMQVDENSISDNTSFTGSSISLSSDDFTGVDTDESDTESVGAPEKDVNSNGTRKLLKVDHSQLDDDSSVEIDFSKPSPLQRQNAIRKPKVPRGISEDLNVKTVKFVDNVKAFGQAPPKPPRLAQFLNQPSTSQAVSQEPAEALESNNASVGKETSKLDVMKEGLSTVADRLSAQGKTMKKNLRSVFKGFKNRYPKNS
ncbi:hypothetical protein CLAVI_000347 [Candidatus Clavichlamydia salmonicola]|uniref:hypothetical protein n=1 Tax=Candidatus Clavichlamydia salmonicola TaxID=469812 RepID=UPI00189193BC|nr:hypothetical protein [Candidatus Clavichlamydia salmonicola]MBF5050729.1 hypothetical protein [Candidatus Clavichlamydia salmonicola]